MKNLAFFKCNTCGNVAVKLVDSKIPLFCCGKPMEALVANTNDGATEKHVPVTKLEGNKLTVSVGEVEHPMTEAHYIQFVAVETNKNAYVKNFEPTDKPVCDFILADDEEVKAVYAYCNLHSLWKI